MATRIMAANARQKSLTNALEGRCAGGGRTFGPDISGWDRNTWQGSGQPNEPAIRSPVAADRPAVAQPATLRWQPRGRSERANPSGLPGFGFGFGTSLVP